MWRAIFTQGNNMLNDYTRLLTPFPGSVAENEESYQFLTERHLQALWYDQKFFEFLKTDDNQPIQVLSPGIWNTEAGPDFLKAHLKIGGVELKGDIEIHLRTAPGSSMGTTQIPPITMWSYTSHCGNRRKGDR